MTSGAADLVAGLIGSGMSYLERREQRLDFSKGNKKSLKRDITACFKEIDILLRYMPNRCKDAIVVIKDSKAKEPTDNLDSIIIQLCFGFGSEEVKLRVSKVALEGAYINDVIYLYRRIRTCAQLLSNWNLANNVSYDIDFWLDKEAKIVDEIRSIVVVLKDEYKKLKEAVMTKPL